MGIGVGIGLVQTQKLIMTPELRQAINILQMPSPELAQHIEKEVMENPLLEAEENWDWREYVRDLTRVVNKDVIVSEDEREPVSAQELSLQEYLLQQLGLYRLSDIERNFLIYLIGNIDEAGYLTCELQESCQQFKLAPDHGQKLLETLQSFEPAGVGANGLKECLKLQLQQREINDEVVTAIIDQYLVEVADGKLKQISKDLGVSLARVQQAVDLVRSLNPKPGWAFGGAGEVRYIFPDVFVERVDDELIVVLNESGIPKLTINNTYKHVLLSNEDQEASKYVEDKLNRAAFLIKSIEQRKNTVFKVAKFIVEWQRDFFEQGTRALRPLTMKQVADSIGVHESTISRAVNNKYMQTPRGLLAFKYFFATGVGGATTSNTGVKQVLLELIKQEDSAKPLSDQRLSELLAAQGMVISRRTVAKYREEMGIQGTTQRKRY